MNKEQITSAAEEVLKGIEKWDQEQKLIAAGMAKGVNLLYERLTRTEKEASTSNTTTSTEK